MNNDYNIIWYDKQNNKLIIDNDVTLCIIFTDHKAKSHHLSEKYKFIGFL